MLKYFPKLKKVGKWTQLSDVFLKIKEKIILENKEGERGGKEEKL